MAALKEDYEKAGFGGALKPGRTPALLLVDFLYGYADRDSPLYAGIEDVLAAAADLLDLCRSSGRPIFHTRVAYTTSDGREGGVFTRKLPLLLNLQDGSRAAEIHEKVKPRPDELILTKHYASAFYGTSLASTLTAAGIDTLLITGLTTSGCIRATAVDACQSGFVPIVVKDAVGDRQQEPHDANLFDLQAKYAEVIPLADAKRIIVNRA